MDHRGKNRRILLAACTGLCLVACLSLFSLAEERIPWTTSRIHGSPEPPLPFVVKRIFPEVEFKNPVDFAIEPKSGEWFILQLDGKLFRLNPQESEQPQLVHDAHLEIEKHDRSYGIEFHPNYIENRKIYLSYILKGKNADGTHVSEFLMSDATPQRVHSDSEKLLIYWPSGGHNGACLKFGPDGYLYITAGDGTAPFPPDGANVGQDLSDLRSTIMRIDVDQPGDIKPYSVPADNPFLHLADARPEVWAFGFRNPWKISFDSQTGDLWCGDVGWELWELIFNVKKAGNYGWSIKEGSQPIRTDLKQGPGEIIPPVVQHAHTEAASMTGGYVYHGNKLPELTKRYVYGDYVSGKIWALRDDPLSGSVTEEIADTSLAIITFGVDADGELIVVDYAGGLYRIVPNDVPDTSQNFPHMLSETGLFQEHSTHLINQPGVYSYELNAKMWQDGANSGAVVAIPESGSITWVKPHHRWVYPTDTVFAKTLAKWTVFENTLAHRRIETQILHFDGNEWKPYSYLWNDEQTDATLVPSGGQSKNLVIQNPYQENELQEIQWRVHSRAECMSCHVNTAGYVLGFDLPNLNRETSLLKDQLKLLSDINIFDKQIPKPWTKSAMVSHQDTGELTNQARSYLAINCAHCHRRGGGGTAAIEFPFEHALDKTNSIDVPPTQGTFGIPNAKIIAPGDPYRSVLYYRMATIGRGHMPHLGTTNVDREGMQLIADWIGSLSEVDQPMYLEAVNSQSILDSILNNKPNGQEIEHAFASTPQALALAEAVHEVKDFESRHKIASVLTEQSPPHLRGVFESFLPPEERQQTLGTAVDSHAILEMGGDVENGKEIFHRGEGISCRNCHQISGEGRQIGPDLSKIGSQRSRSEILTSILDPSLKIDPKYLSRAIVTTEGQVVSGLLIEENSQSLTLKDARGKVHKISRSAIEEMVTQPRSLMPDLLVRELTAQELVDLLDYLFSLK
jgi:putative heme-binding domain-containing protein